MGPINTTPRWVCFTWHLFNSHLGICSLGDGMNSAECALLSAILVLWQQLPLLNYVRQNLANHCNKVGQCELWGKVNNFYRAMHSIGLSLP